MTKTTLLLGLLLVAPLGGCDDDSSPGGGSADMAGNAGGGDLAMAGGFPAAPTLGMQIDRMGRAGVNTALTDPFWDSTGDGSTGLEAHHAKQDAYNQSSDPATWPASFGPAIKASLAVYDALDQDAVTGTTKACGTQLAYGALSMPDYTVLGGLVLPDDELYVNSDHGTCAAYLAVETNTLGLANSDCGGRTPNYDTIDITYAALAGAELLASPPANLNGIAADPDGAADLTTFPWLNKPNTN
jgi:hypothetical protein